MGEISMSGSTREGGAAVIGLRASHPVLSPLLYWFNPPFRALLRVDRGRISEVEKEATNGEFEARRAP